VSFRKVGHVALPAAGVDRPFFNLLRIEPSSRLVTKRKNSRYEH
jgi:hypothetical protein